MLRNINSSPGLGFSVTTFWMAFPTNPLPPVTIILFLPATSICATIDIRFNFDVIQYNQFNIKPDLVPTNPKDGIKALDDTKKEALDSILGLLSTEGDGAHNIIRCLLSLKK